MPKRIKQCDFSRYTNAFSDAFAISVDDWILSLFSICRSAMVVHESLVVQCWNSEWCRNYSKFLTVKVTLISACL